ncbi:MAG TPA: CBS domain-containing protein [Campylobacterales bacterium]|nr:CBS domain-containing protein [Campylobacterales bacterium]
MAVLQSIAHNLGFTLNVTATVSEAMACMLENGSGTVVLLVGTTPVGIVTESLLIEKLGEGVDLASPVIALARTSLITIHENRPLETAFDLVVSHNIRRLIVVNDGGDFVGILLQEDLFDFLEEDVYKVDLKVFDLLAPSSMVISISKHRTIQDALVLMHVKRIGSVIVSNNEGEALGIVTEKDILSAGHKRMDLSQPVSGLMSSPVFAVEKEDAITEVISLMRRENIRRVLVKEKNGSMCGLLSNRDIFHHIKGNVARMLEIKLRHAQEIMDLLPEAIVEIFDMPSEQVIHWMNREAKALFGELFLEKSPIEWMGQEAWEKLYGTVLEKGMIQGVMIVINDKSFELSGTLSKNINNRYIKLIVKDITEHETIKQQLQDEVLEESRLRRENEYLMMQQSRMASMGEMVGHIAHQWRQPLAQLGGIFMNLESAYTFGDFDKAYLEEKVKQGNEMITYMSQTIDDFHLFFSPERIKESFDLVHYVKRSVDIVLASLDYHHIEVVLEGEEEQFFTKGYPNEFAQAILNLLNNARDALSQSSVNPKKIDIFFSVKNSQISILFCDNGGGISPALLPVVFEPFVTEKQESGGTGAGLYITRLIIEQKMGGKIEAYNRHDGACFQILLPKI